MSIQFAGLVLSLAFALPAFAAAPPAFSARYEVLRNGDVTGEATINFSAGADGRYQLRTITNGTSGLAALAGLHVEETSILSWRGQQPETLSYDYVQKAGWKARERHLRVDAANQRIVYRDKDRDYAPTYRAGVLDRHAITVALMQDLALGKSGELVFWVPDKDGLQPWRYRTGDTTTLQTALGPQPGLRVDRIRNDDSGRKTTLWLATGRGFVPLRLIQSEDNGESIELRILSLR